jgi:hypothetical protein
MEKVRRISHGRLKYYQEGCRCDVCVHGQTEYNRKREDKRKVQRVAARESKLDAQPLIDLLYDKIDPRSSIGRKLRYWKRFGVDVYAADKFCCEMGYHPVEVFGDAWWKGAFDEQG